MVQSGGSFGGQSDRNNFVFFRPLPPPAAAGRERVNGNGKVYARACNRTSWRTLETGEHSLADGQI